MRRILAALGAGRRAGRESRGRRRVGSFRSRRQFAWVECPAVEFARPCGRLGADAHQVPAEAGRCWTELRRPLRAVPVLERVLSGFDDTHARDKALYLTWLATSYLEAREVEQAAATLARAADLAAGVSSVRPAVRIGVVARRLTRYRSTPVVADLLTRLGA